SSHNVTVLEGDTNGDKTADFGIELSGNLALGPSSLTAGSLLQALVLTGTAGGDTPTGGKEEDPAYRPGGHRTAAGKGGNDYLDGGTGADSMTGGLGNDTYVVDNAGDVVTEGGGGGGGSGFTPPSGWTIKGTADVNGDGQTDAFVSSATANELWLLNNG